MKIVIKRLKAELKVLAALISETNKQFKQEQREGKSHWNSDALKRQGSAGYEFRHRHIVRSLLQGRTMEQIETLPKEGRCPKETCYCCNKPNQKYIDRLMKESQDETVRRDQVGSVEEPASSSVVPCGGDLDHGAPAPLVGAERVHDLPQGQGAARTGEPIGFAARVYRAFGFS